MADWVCSPPAISGQHRVVVVVTEDVNPFELGVACEVFGLERPELNVPWYQFKVAACAPQPIVTGGGFSMTTPYGIEALTDADTLVFPNWTDPAVSPSDELLNAVRAAYARGARLLSICSGVFVLAAAGVLDGRNATTHWMYTDLLARHYPAICVNPSVLYMDSGQVLTSAGTAAGIDLCLHIVRLDYGAEIANAVARRMVVPPHREGGQAQYIEQPVHEASEPDAFQNALNWAIAHLDQPLSVDVLAREALMSPRTFARRFQSVYGTTPHRWLLHQRLLYARRLLETSDEPIERIADQAGFGSSAALRVHFQRGVSTSPIAYRRLFSRTGPVQSAQAT